MTRNQVLYGAIIIVVLLIIYNSFDQGETREEYIQRITEERAAKDLFFEEDKESPMPDSIDFAGLNYYPPNPDYRIQADFIRSASPVTITLSTNDGKKREYLEYGYAEFELEGVRNRLLVLQMEEPYEDKLFIPFADETSTLETYGAGRYLEAEKPSGDLIELDFNLSYNPYCAYSGEYSCAFPPRENLLSVAIEAGEKKYFEK